jgi:hypothetical protein
VIFLFIAGGAYVGFVVGAGASGLWFLAEMVHVVVIGTIGLLGLRGSPYWIALGWALHPLWDVPLHYIGPGETHLLPQAGRFRVSLLIGWLLFISSSLMDYLMPAGWGSERSLLNRSASDGSSNLLLTSLAARIRAEH